MTRRREGKGVIEIEAKTVYQALKTVQEQLDSFRNDVPVTRQEFRDVLDRVNDLDFSVSRMSQIIREQYAAGIKTGLIAAAVFGCVVGVAVITFLKAF